MNNNSHMGFENFQQKDETRLREKKNIKSVGNIIGVVFIILWASPLIVYRSVAAVANLLGFSNSLTQAYNEPAVNLVISTVMSVLLFTLPFLIIPSVNNKKLSELISFGRPDKELFLPTLLIGIGGSAFANFATNNFSSFFASFGINFISPSYEFPKGVFGLILSLISVAVTPALVEEFSMRGTVMGSVKEYGESFAVLTSATIFALIHGNLVQIPFAFIMGLLIGWAVIKTNSLWTGVIIHFANNAVSVILEILCNNIDSVLIQSAISVLYFSVCILLFFLGILLVKKQGSRVWQLKEAETKLRLGEKLKCFFSAPMIIISIVLTALNCMQMISFG